MRCRLRIALPRFFAPRRQSSRLRPWEFREPLAGVRWNLEKRRPGRGALRANSAGREAGRCPIPARRLRARDNSAKTGDSSLDSLRCGRFYQSQGRQKEAGIIRAAKAPHRQKFSSNLSIFPILPPPTRSPALAAPRRRGLTSQLCSVPNLICALPTPPSYNASQLWAGSVFWHALQRLNVP